MEIKLIAFDLDGTLLREDKTVSPANQAALRAAAAQGVFLVPATGRIYPIIPEQVKQMPEIRYFICGNGASVYDKTAAQEIYSAQIPLERTLALLSYIDQQPYPVIYDCYADNCAWTSQRHYDLADTYITNFYSKELFKRFRRPVPKLADYIRQRGGPVQKVQLYFKEPGDRAGLVDRLARDFPDIQVSSSISNNLEINWKDAGKHTALRVLCDHLGLSLGDTMALGDGSNDIGMLEAAGIGVAMENAAQNVRCAADSVTACNECDGVAQAIARYCRAAVLQRSTAQ